MLVAALGELAAAPLLRLLQVPDDVFPLALLYLRIYLLGMPVILLYNFEAAIFRSVGETKIPLLALAVSGVVNVALNLFFVAVLGMTVNGVAIATVISNALSSAILYFRLRTTAREVHVEPHLLRIDLGDPEAHPAHRPARGIQSACSRCRTSSSSRRSTASVRSSWRPRARRLISRSSPTTS